MCTWVIRSAVISLLLLSLAGCGGDDDSGAAAPLSCTPNMMSTMLVGGPNDPCPQDFVATDGTYSCLRSQGFMAVTMCNPDGTWSTQCQCVSTTAQNPATSAGSMTGTSGTGAAVCGNGMLEGTEQCDLTAMGTGTCATLGFSGGVVSCNTNCTYNTSMCSSAPGGSGGSSG